MLQHPGPSYEHTYVQEHATDGCHVFPVPHEACVNEKMGPPYGKKWRFVDEETGITHVQSTTTLWAAITTACGINVGFGEPWDTNLHLVVTCIRCAGAK